MQVIEAFGWLEAFGKGVAANLKIGVEVGLPVLMFLVEQGLKDLTARVSFATVFQLKALAVVGDDCEHIGAGPGALA
jgi:hypothetical protein